MTAKGSSASAIFPYYACLGFTHISAVSLSECPRLQPSLYLPPPSLNGLNIWFSLGVGFPGELHVIILSTDVLLMNLALSIHAIILYQSSWCPYPGISLVIHNNLNVSTALYTTGAC